MKKIWLIRHGETQGNHEKRYIGMTDESLNETGHKQACDLHVGQVDAVYTSPLKRCMETAQIVFPTLSHTVSDGLRECNFGIFEGKNADEMADCTAYRDWIDSGCMAAIPNGESVQGFKDRCCAAFMDQVNSSSDSTIAFVIHGGCIMAILERFEGKKAFYDYHIGNGEAVLCELDDAGKLHITGGALC